MAPTILALGWRSNSHCGVLDCAFSVVKPNSHQHCFNASRRAPTERTETQVGPFRIEVIEPMRRTRVVLDDNASGISCDLTFSARTASIKEACETLWSGAALSIGCDAIRSNWPAGVAGFVTRMERSL